MFDDKEYGIKWRLKHPNYHKEYNKKHKQYQKKYQDKYQPKRREENKVHKHEYYKKYYEKNKQKFVDNRVKRKYSILELNDHTITTDGLDYLLEYQKTKCNICKCDLRRVKKNLDHIIPLSKWWLHSIFNVQWLCERCNKSKHDSLPKGQLNIFNIF